MPRFQPLARCPGLRSKGMSPHGSRVPERQLTMLHSWLSKKCTDRWLQITRDTGQNNRNEICAWPGKGTPSGSYHDWPSSCERHYRGCSHRLQHFNQVTMVVTIPRNRQIARFRECRMVAKADTPSEVQAMCTLRRRQGVWQRILQDATGSRWQDRTDCSVTTPNCIQHTNWPSNADGNSTRIQAQFELDTNHFNNHCWSGN